MLKVASVLISVILAVSVVKAEDTCEIQSDPCQSWDYATTLNQRVDFYSLDSKTSVVSFDLKKIDLHHSPSEQCTRTDSENCDVAWKDQRISYAAMGPRRTAGDGKCGWDFVVATKTRNSGFHAIHYGRSSRMPCQLRRIFASRVSSIKGVAYSKGELFWAECHPGATSTTNFNGIWRVNLTASSRDPVAEKIEGTQDFDICSMTNFVVDAANPGTVNNLFNFFWVNRTDFVLPSVIQWTWDGGIGEISEPKVLFRDRNPHGLEVVKDTLYWANNPSYNSFELRKYFIQNKRPVVRPILESGQHGVTSLGVTCTEDMVLSDAVGKRSYIVMRNDRVLHKKLSQRQVPTKIVSKASVFGCN